ncbi:hypothetical protein QUW44_03375 [Limosilactobacillus pontis]|uniref:Uncharacterized protein n=1 Tax=Limosilactobacillus pontis TaxID=35787 RepID=A0ABT7UWX4_9LACO|nr:hypothetical protein [Limosilactobacillus pontis]MDM8266215.1 hypothetical protein [Limosilactobacillus pontis]HJA75086.1 hypothetical protein [Candidatus Limosilactobacillus gallistercoris]
MNEQEEHVKQFLTSSTYHQLSANQQKHAQDILVRFNQQMKNEQHLADTAWTPQAVKEVMVGDFIADPALTNQFGIAVAPVLKAYQKFLGVDQLKEIVQAIDDQRANMNACRKAHKTWAQLHGTDTAEQSSAAAKPASKPAQPAPTVKIQPTAPAKPAWSEEKLAQLIKQVKRDMPAAPEFQHQALSLDEQQYVAAEFLNLMHQEFNEYPGEWVFADLQRVLGMMMPLDPAITPKQIKNIVPTAQALFDYLKRNGVITMDQYKVGMKAIANMQNSQEMLASLSRKERETQLMLSFINSNGINTDDVQAAEAWMDDHRDEVAAFMRTLLNPWRDYEHQQLVKRQEESRRRTQLASANGGKVTHHRAPRGIKFSKKARKKRRRK